MTKNKIAVMDEGRCIFRLRGDSCFFRDKFDRMRHPSYNHLVDADQKNIIDVERCMKRRPAIVKPDEAFDPI